MSLTSAESKKKCENCLEYVKIYVTCLKCDAAYHIHCWKKVAGAYVNKRGQLFCCGGLTSNYAGIDTKLEIQDNPPEGVVEKENTDGYDKDLENSSIKEEDSEWNEFKCDACHVEFSNEELLQNHCSECPNKGGGFVQELKEDKDLLEKCLHKEEDLEWSEFRCGACLLEFTNKEHFQNHYSECPNKEEEFIQELMQDKDLENHLPEEENSEPNEEHLKNHCSTSLDKQGGSDPGLNKDKASLFCSSCNEENFQKESYEQHIKRCHVESSTLQLRLIRDASNPLEIYNNEELLQRYRFGRDSIQNILLPLVYPPANHTNRGQPIPPLTKLCTALRFYASGNFQRVCGDLSNISQSSVCRIVNEVSELIARKLGIYVRFPATEAALARNRIKFFEIARFPGVLGCVDGTHIPIKSPGGTNSEIFRNTKGWISLNVQVVAGPNLEILDIVIRWPGSAHDSRIFNRSSVCVKLEKRQLSGILLGDGAYQQTRYTYTPVRNPQTRAQHRYNTAHSRTRNVVERTFRVWKGRFRCLTNALQCSCRNATRIIAATSVLHNIARSRGERLDVEEAIEEEIPAATANERGGGNIIQEAFIQRHFI